MVFSFVIEIWYYEHLIGQKILVNGFFFFGTIGEVFVCIRFKRGCLKL